MQNRNYLTFILIALIAGTFATSCAREVSPALPPAAPQNSPPPEFLPDVNPGDMNRVREDLNKPTPNPIQTSPAPSTELGLNVIRVRLFPLTANDLPSRDPFSASEQLQSIGLKNDGGLDLQLAARFKEPIRTKTIRINLSEKSVQTDDGTFPLGELRIVPVNSKSESEVNAFIMSDTKMPAALKFKGHFEFSKNSESRWHLVNFAALNDYVASVTSSEIPSSWTDPSARSFEAVKAQAIAARSYALTALITSRKKTNRKWDVLPTTKYQVYFGVRPNSSDFIRAAEETKNSVLCYDGNSALAAFSANSGGYTCSSKDCWGNDLPYLAARPDTDEVKKLPGGEKRIIVPFKELNLSLGRSLKTEASPSITGIEIAKINESGRVRRVNVIVQNRTLPLDEEQTTHFLFKAGFKLGRLLKIESMEKENVTFTTSGFGHGVGMSQWGAYALSRQGKTAEEILKFYYRDSRVEDFSKK